jgi:hypothetical protein
MNKSPHDPIAEDARILADQLIARGIATNPQSGAERVALARDLDAFRPPAAPDVADLTVTTDGRAVYLGAGSPALVVWIEQAFPAGTWQDDEDGRPWYRIRDARFRPGAAGLAAEFFPADALHILAAESLTLCGDTATVDNIASTPGRVDCTECLRIQARR